MNMQIKTPCKDGVNDRTYTKIKSHKHCTKIDWLENPYVITNLGVIQ